MTKKDSKIQIEETDVKSFLEAIDDVVKRADAYKILEMMEEISGYKAKMWGSSIIGFGTYHYVYDSGREGDSMKVGFSPRKANLVLYIMGGFNKYRDKLTQFGKHKTGKSCLYIKCLSDVDEVILRQMIKADVDYMNEKYG